jgi:hypothetical protein
VAAMVAWGVVSDTSVSPSKKLGRLGLLGA